MKKKTLLWIVGIFVVWQLLRNDTAINSVLAFLFDGVVPGTNIVLSPNIILASVLAIFTAGICVFLLTSVLRKRRLQVRTSIPNEPADALLPAKQQTKLPKPPPSRTSAMLWGRRIIAYGLFYLENVPPVANKIGRDVLLTAEHVTSRLLAVYGRAAVVAARAKVKGHAAVIVCWAWAVPVVWKFDAWLERHTRRFIMWLKKKLSRHENIAFLFLISQESIKLTHAFQPTIKRQFLKAKQLLHQTLLRF